MRIVNKYFKVLYKVYPRCSQENSVDGEPVAEVEEVPSVAVASAPSVPSHPSGPQGPLPPTASTCHELHDLSDDPVAEPDSEPSFKTVKERECWKMFRKMAEKGVTVSYDTVLRYVGGWKSNIFLKMVNLN